MINDIIGHILGHAQMHQNTESVANFEEKTPRNRYSERSEESIDIPMSYEER